MKIIFSGEARKSNITMDRIPSIINNVEIGDLILKDIQTSKLEHLNFNTTEGNLKVGKILFKITVEIIEEY